MVNFGKFVHTQTGKYIMSILLGFGLASLFRTVCKDKECVIFHAPPLEEIKDKIYSHDNKCYKYTPAVTKCSKDKKIVEFNA
jgi:hypothetical protein